MTVFVPPRSLLDWPPKTVARVAATVGINAKTARQVHEAGATVLVAGNSVFKAQDYQEAIRALRSLQARMG